ncbi:MAG: hypothetical protein V1855_05180 [bacterium]
MKYVTIIFYCIIVSFGLMSSQDLFCKPNSIEITKAEDSAFLEQMSAEDYQIFIEEIKRNFGKESLQCEEYLLLAAQIFFTGLIVLTGLCSCTYRAGSEPDVNDDGNYQP